jgi:hypothetical protein
MLLVAAAAALVVKAAEALVLAEGQLVCATLATIPAHSPSLQALTGFWKI